MRSLSPVFRRASYAQDTKEVVLELLEISHANLVTPIRVVNNLEAITSQGYTWAAFPFEVSLPIEADDQIPVMTLRIDNVDRQIVTAIRNLQGRPDVKIDIVVASQPDIVETTFAGYKLSNVTYDNLVVDGELRLEEILSEPYPQHRMTPFHFPGMYGAY